MATQILSFSVGRPSVKFTSLVAVKFIGLSARKETDQITLFAGLPVLEMLV